MRYSWRYDGIYYYTTLYNLNMMKSWTIAILGDGNNQSIFIGIYIAIKLSLVFHGMGCITINHIMSLTMAHVEFYPVVNCFI
jgi:hypothetical protein